MKSVILAFLLTFFFSILTYNIGYRDGAKSTETLYWRYLKEILMDNAELRYNLENHK